jgi:hypothetical protein
MTFNDLKIVMLDTTRTAESTKESAMPRLYLKLSETPNADWSSLFDAGRIIERHSMWRHAWTEESYIVIECPLDELERYHIAELKEDVKNTNVKYREALVKQLDQKKREEDAAAAERKKLDDLNDRLNFD